MILAVPLRGARRAAAILDKLREPHFVIGRVTSRKRGAPAVIYQ
jgi:hypothetical protein